MNDVNGNSGQAQQVYVSFGPGPTDQVPLEWAESMLTKWRAMNPKQFGKVLADIVAPVPARGR